MTQPLTESMSVYEGFKSGILTEKFFAEYFEKEPHLFTKEEFPDGYDLVQSLIDVDRYIAMTLRAGNRVKLFKMGKSVEGYSAPHVAYLDGCSLVMNQSDRLNVELYEFCKSLRPDLHHTFAVTYLTPPNSNTVPIHNDDQDTFLWQVWGEKTWRVYGPSPTALIYSEEMQGKEGSIPAELQRPLLFEKTIKAGELLYIPRGWLHAATTAEQSSLHVTITTASCDYCWGANTERVVRESLQGKYNLLPADVARPVGEEDLSMRRSVPVGGRNAMQENRVAALEAALEKIKAALTVETLEKTFFEHISRVNEQQDRMMSLYVKDFPPELPIKLKSSCVSLQGDIKGAVEGTANQPVAVFHKQGKGTLRLPVDPSAVPLLREICKVKKPIAIVNLPGKDSLAKMCVLLVLLEKGVLSVHNN